MRKKAKLLAWIWLLLVASISISYQTKAASDLESTLIVNQCDWMDTANVHHSIEDQILTIKWDEIQWDSVDISIFDDERWYVPLGTVNMTDREFRYQIQARGEHRFLLSNGCNDYYYTVNFDIHQAYPQELIDATHWAEANGVIPDNPNINSHYLYGSLNNIELADIMNKYAENVLNKTPDTSKSCSFDDFNELTNNQKNIVRKSCQLWLMPWDKTSTSFNPYEEVNRAVFGTVFSRALWWEQYEGGEPYYSGHLNALKAAGIMNQIDNPEDRLEIKWYVLLMLMRVSASASTLTNNITETVEFSTNNVNEQIVFSWNYTADEDFILRWFEFTELNKIWFISWDTMNFSTYVDWEEVGHLWFNMGCDRNYSDFLTCNWEYYFSVSIWWQTLSINKWDTINIQIVAELDWWYSSDNIYLYNMKLKDTNYNTISMNLAPIKIVNTTNYSEEMVEAYNRAYENWLTTEPNIEGVNMFWELSKMELAKIMVNYAKNVLNQTPDTSKACNFTDIDSIKWELYDYIIESCQLSLMWQGTTTFRPNDIITQAEFGTYLSRALWWDEFEWWTPYYSGHLNALKAAGIMNQIDNPEKTVMLKWYVLLMLMRAAPNYGEINCEDPIVQLACAAQSDECPVACRTNKCDVNWDWQIGIGDQVRYTNNCVGYSTIVPWKEKCDVNWDWQIGIGDQVALGNCITWTGSNSWNNEWNNNSTETNKCDVNWDWQIGIGDQVRYTNNCVGYSTIVPWKEKCDVNWDWQIGIGDQVALGNCITWTGSNSWNSGWNSNSQNSTTKKEEPKSQWYSWGGGWWRSSTTKASRWNSTTKTDNNKKTSTENARTTATSTNVKWNTITSTDKRPIDYMVPTINKVEYNEWNSSEVLENWFTRERNNAYGFAYANWITTAKNIEKANLSWPMTRAAMAKMLSNYAINVLGKEPDTSKTPHFWDISKEVDKQYDNWITLAYQLWIMWVWAKNFRPYDPVTRGEFVTVLSRMLYDTPDWTWKSKYYEPHMAKLYNEWIISKTDPSKTEKRWNVMTMLMRSAK